MREHHANGIRSHGWAATGNTTGEKPVDKKGGRKSAFSVGVPRI
jgi:hypothetical protein